MNKEQGSLFSRLFPRKKPEEQSSEPLEKQEGVATAEEELFRKILAITGAFFRSTNASRLKEKEPWFGSLARLMACCGYETFKPSDDRQMACARAHWKAMVFALPCLQPAQKKGLPMDMKSVLRRFQEQFTGLEIEFLSKMPEEPLTVEVEDVGSRFRIALSLLKTLENQNLCDLSICSTDPAHAVEFHDLYYVLEREVELYPGEFVTKKSPQNVEFHRCHVNNVGFKIDSSLSAALHQKVLRPMSIQKVEENDTWWYNFIVVC
jgi:hypothetical protein